MTNKIIKYFGFYDINRKDIVFVVICSLLTVILLFLPTGFENNAGNTGIRVKAEIIETDNDNLHIIGLIKTGEQGLKVKILQGKFKGQTVFTVNHFLGKLDFDKFYQKGEKVFAVLEISDNKISGIQVIDRYRLDASLLLLLVFVLFLILYAGWVGFKILISFFFTIIAVWKVLLPGYLKFFDPVIFSMVIVLILTAVIIFLVAGFTKKGITAFLGALAGVLLTCILSIVSGSFFNIPGEIMPYSETLLYTGFMKLKLSQIFISGIFIASSGAVMDVAIDVSAAMDEITVKKPEITLKELIKSGFIVGRAVIGTMTTTLLLAYFGGYSTLMMVFIAQGIPIMNILNYQMVSSEILLTIVGSFGLVSVAPLTAIIGGFVYKGRRILFDK